MKSDVPAVVGVPEIVPLALSVSPAGSDPAVRVHVMEFAPAALRVWVYEDPTTALGRTESVVTTRLTVSVKILLALEYWSAAPTVKVNVPAVDGVPERVPVDELSVNPAGRSPET